MDTMRRDQTESSCAIQAKLDAILRSSTSQDRPVTDRTQGNRVDFVEPQRNKRESTPLPLPRDAASTAPGGGGGGRQDNYEKWNTDSSDRGGGKSRKTFKKPKEFKDDSDLGRSLEIKFGTRQLERQETSLHSDTQQLRRHGVEMRSCKE